MEGLPVSLPGVQTGAQPDAGDLEALRQALNEKASKEDLEALRARLDGKADRTELDALLQASPAYRVHHVLPCPSTICPHCCAQAGAGGAGGLGGDEGAPLVEVGEDGNVDSKALADAVNRTGSELQGLRNLLIVIQERVTNKASIGGGLLAHFPSTCLTSGRRLLVSHKAGQTIMLLPFLM